MEEYQRLELLGEGTYGVVHKALHVPTGRLVALKKTIMEKDDGIPSTTIREVALLRSLNSQHVVKLHHVFHAPDENKHPSLFLVFEYLDFDLRQFMRAKFGRGKSIGTALSRRFLFQLLQGTHFCHTNGVMHRDLKPANLLVNQSTNTIKIADFGLARMTDIPVQYYSSEVVTLWYRAPELLLGEEHYTHKVDVWSIGCIFAEMLRGKALFKGKTQIHQLFEIFSKLGTPTEEMWPGVTSMPNWHIYPEWKEMHIVDVADWPRRAGRRALTLLKGMLEMNPAKRLSVEEALASNYFDAIRDNRSSPVEFAASPVSPVSALDGTSGARAAGTSTGRRRRNRN